MGPVKIDHNAEFPSEFTPDPECYVLFATNGLTMGRMIASSKSQYCTEHQGELVIFNANVITKTHGKIWYGDLNLNLDFDSLKDVADKLGEDLYILMEGDARFGYEKQPIEALLSKARKVILCNKKLKEKYIKEKPDKNKSKGLKTKAKAKAKKITKTKKDGTDN